ncbi:MAG: 5-formyltetrahydrofolate cyclo-ligase [Clostridium sp.]|nr:5-formyltetrahydrofolate cyclo-ligase [Clostridium sp.]
MKSKKEIRKEILDSRKALPKDEVIKRSNKIRDRLLNFEGFITSKYVMLYMDFANEVMTDAIIEYCLKCDKIVALPLIKSSGGRKKIDAYQPKDYALALRPGTYGILEPVKQLSLKIEPDKIDMVLTPGVAFDLKGSRIGYGAGYYDFFFQQTRDNCFKLGLAFELQIVHSIPKEEHDVSMDAIITEDRSILF